MQNFICYCRLITSFWFITFFFLLSATCISFSDTCLMNTSWPILQQEQSFKIWIFSQLDGLPLKIKYSVHGAVTLTWPDVPFQGCEVFCSLLEAFSPVYNRDLKNAKSQKIAKSPGTYYNCLINLIKMSSANPNEKVDLQAYSLTELCTSL